MGGREGVGGEGGSGKGGWVNFCAYNRRQYS